MAEFKIVPDYKLMGDQMQAVDKIVQGIMDEKRAKTLIGVTAFNKTFTIGNTIE